MGEVYLARDTQLDRAIALKILTAEVARDQQRLHRFLQEARAASALSHPNVAHIYEIGEASGAYFIAMEYVEGQPLDKKIGGHPVAVIEILDIAIQVADALDEAHAKGITHRDIKSSNIMITSRGRVKVLDFGLAKLATPAGVTDFTSNSELATRVKTTPGIVMGTVNYMSPEQALGREVDHRTDIFSFGVVLYEMATGRLPFTGQTVTETIDRLTHAQPEAIARLNYDVPTELEVIIKKALRKDRDERYQTLHDVLLDLKELKRDLDVATGLERSTPPPSPSTEVPTPPLSQSVIGSTSISPAPQTGAVPAVHPTSSAEYIVGEIKRHKTGVGLGAGLLLVVIIAAGVWIYKLAATNRFPSGSRPIKFTRLTSGGKIGNAPITGAASISPDGKYVAFLVEEGGKGSIWVEQVSTNSLHQVVPPAEGGAATAFSRDGEFLYYDWHDASNPQGVLYQLPVLGGTPRRVLANIASPISFSPDGKRFAFVREDPGQGDSILMIANADGSQEKMLASRKMPDYLSTDGPSWSPDGKSIACGVGNFFAADFSGTVIEVPVEGGPERLMTSQKWSRVARVVWLADSSGLIVTAFPELAATGTQIWLLSYPTGEARRITNDLNGYGTVSLGVTADGSAIVTVQEDWSAQIWSVPANEDMSHGRRLTTGKYDGIQGVSWGRDGKIVYVTKVGDNSDIWLMNADGTANKQLTADAYLEGKPVFSPDGRYIVFTASRSGKADIWRMDADGNNPKQLTSDGNLNVGAVSSPDSSTVVYMSLRAGKWTLWKMPIDGGAPVQLTDFVALFPTISPDGKFIACLAPVQANKPRLAILSIEGGPPIKIFDMPFDVAGYAGLKWTSDGRAVTYVDRNLSSSTLWSQSLEGGPPRKITSFKEHQILAFDWSQDGKQLVMSYGNSTDDVVLIKDFR